MVTVPVEYQVRCLIGLIEVNKKSNQNGSTFAFLLQSANIHAFHVSLPISMEYSYNVMSPAASSSSFKDENVERLETGRDADGKDNIVQGVKISSDTTKLSVMTFTEPNFL